MQISRVEDTYFRKNATLKAGDKLIDLSVPKVMGILNLTPDSFYSNSRISGETSLLQRVENMIKDGVDVIDIGGYSSRPGAEHISEDEEIKRVEPAIRSIKKQFPEIPVSLDTFRAEVAKSGLDLGVEIINDISGYQIEPEIIDVVAKYKAAYILMHMKGTPQTMVKESNYKNLFLEMTSYFSQKINEIQLKGITDIIIDPGFGFSKTSSQSNEILNNLETFHFLEKPLLVGVSRKSMIYKKLGITQDEALNGTTVLNTLAVLKGASFLRTHDVKEAVQVIRLLS